MCKVTARHACNNSKSSKYADYAVLSNNTTQNNQKNSKGDDDVIMEIIGPQYGIVYLLKDPRDPLLHIYFYESDLLDDVSTFFLNFKFYFFIIKYSINKTSEHFLN